MAIGNNMANFLTFSLHTKQALFEINKHSSKLYDSLKVKQIQCLRKIYENNDAIACLPTWYGKSLVYDIYLTSAIRMILLWLYYWSA